MWRTAALDEEIMHNIYEMDRNGPRAVRIAKRSCPQAGEGEKPQREQVALRRVGPFQKPKAGCLKWRT